MNGGAAWENPGIGARRAEYTSLVLFLFQSKNVVGPLLKTPRKIS